MPDAIGLKADGPTTAPLLSSLIYALEPKNVPHL